MRWRRKPGLSRGLTCRSSAGGNLGQPGKIEDALDNISLNIGQALLPAVNSIVTALTPVITSIGQFVANNPYLVEGLAAGCRGVHGGDVSAAMGWSVCWGFWHRRSA